MRWLFALLILLNAGFFIWQYSIQESTEAHPATPLALPPDSNIKPLVLLREVTPTAPATASTVEKVTPQPPPAIASPVPTPTESCYTIGPFITAQDAERASTLLEETGLTSHLRADGAPDILEYWLDIDNSAEQPPPPVFEALWQTLNSTFTNIQQQPRACQ